MKALSFSQPWALFMAHGIKTVENRKQQYGFKTPFPQRILIHAAKSYDERAPLWIHQRCIGLGIATPQEYFTPIEPGIIGVCEFVDAGTPDHICETWPNDAIWVMDDAAWCYVVREDRRFKTPIPYRGQLGFFDVPDEIVAEQLRLVGVEVPA